jgi:iron complex outermembrane recepter protein
MRMFLAFAVGMGVLGGGAATAQEAGSQAVPDPQARDIVVVTGLGPARTSDEMIASTTVLDTDAVVQRLNGGLGDTLAGLPGISSTSFGPGASRPIIRGLGTERVQVLTNGIGVVDASAASPDHAVTGDPLGAERIEILRGPAALAYGGGATGGVINVIDGLIVDRLPKTTFSGMAYGALTSVDDGKQIAGRITGVAGPVVGVLSGSRLDTSSIDIPGYAFSERRRADEIAGGGPAEPFAQGTLLNSAVESSSISGGLSLVGDTAFIGAAVRKLGNTYGIVGEKEAFIDMHQMRYDVRGGLTFNGPITELTASGSVVDYDHTEFEAPGEPGSVFTNEGWEARIEAHHAPIGAFEGSLGVQASDREFRVVGDEALVSPTTTKQAGIFVYETYEQDRWGLEGGLRHDEVKLDNLVNGQRDFETVNASFGGHMHLTDALFGGLSVTRTERAPTDIELFADGPHPATQQYEVGNGALTTETGVNLEASLRWEGSRAQIEGSVYRFAFNDFIFLDDTGTMQGGFPVFAYGQADATFTGAEISGGMNWGQVAGIDWSSDASLDFVRAAFDAGGDVPRIPPASVMIGLKGERGGMDGRIEAQYGAKQDRVSAFETPTDDYLVFNASLGVDLTETVKLMLEGRNLTDESVRVHASPLKEIAPQPGRNFRVAVRAKF